MRWRRTWLIATAASTLLALAWVAVLGLAVWSNLEPAERASVEAVLRPRAAIALLVALLLPVLFALLWRRWIRTYPRAVARLRDEVLIIGNANPGHRVAETGAPEMRELGAAINTLADAHQALGRDVDARIGQANARLAQETSRLAALMAELTQGVLVCNREGRILLYNASASLLLAGATSGDTAAPVGLNRSIFGILDKGPIVHALQQLSRRSEQRLPHPVARFVTTRRDSARDADAAADGTAPLGQLLRAQMVPLRETVDGTETLTGFVLLLDDITREVESESRRDSLLRLLTEGSRAPLANLRAAAETLQAHPAMEPALRGRFVAAIHEEAERLSRQLEDALARGDEGRHSPWPREDILAADLVFALQRSFEAGLGLSCRCEGRTPELWLQLDSHSMVQAVTHLAGALRSALGLREIVLELSQQGRFARLDLRWQGEPLATERLHEWEQQRFSLGDAGRGAMLGEVLMQHGAELWTRPDRDTGLQRLCLQLPTIRPEPAAAEVAAPGRPVVSVSNTVHDSSASGRLSSVVLCGVWRNRSKS
jgi:DNA polymerase III subunit epsilon